MSHRRIDKTTVIYPSVYDTINTTNLTITKHFRETVYFFDGKNIDGRSDITERDGFIETLNHVSECTTCLTDYYVQTVLQYYVNNVNHPYINESLMLKCSRAHDKVSYLD